jgi:hypothetical protein
MRQPARTKDNRLIFLRRSLQPRHGDSARDPLLSSGVPSTFSRLSCLQAEAALRSSSRAIARTSSISVFSVTTLMRSVMTVPGGLPTGMLHFEMPWSASVLRDFEERRAELAIRGVFRLSDYLDDVVLPLWSYWGLDGRAPQREETRRRMSNCAGIARP